MRNDPPDQYRSPDDQPGVPGEAEAADEFETAPQAIPPAGDPRAGDPRAGDPWTADPRAAVPPPATPPSAVESFDTSRARQPADAAPGSFAGMPPAAAHSVPPTAPAGDSTLCPRCGTENRPGVAFCRECGQRLVGAGAAAVERPSAPEGMQTCARCGTLNRAGIPFCQNCGASIRPAAAAAAPTGPGAPQAGAYVPPPATAGVPAARASAPPGRAVLGPIVLLIGAVGLAVAWALPFRYGDGSLFERSFGTPDGYQLAFWSDYPEVGTRLVDQGYFGFAAPVPILVALLLVLAIAGFMRARPGPLQVIGLLIAFLWALGLGVLFVVVEVMGAQTTELTDLLRALTPAGIIFLLASLITLIGLLTRFARS